MANVEATLRELVDICRDGEKGYQKAAEHAKSPDLKNLFTQVSSERARFAEQLDAEVRRLGESASKAGDTAGALHRGWLDVKELHAGSDHTVLAWLEQGDDYAKGKYENAVNSGLPENLSSIVRQQMEAILRTHDRIKSLRDSKAA